MSIFLFHVGRFSARFRWAVIVAWVVIFAALIGILAVGSANPPAAQETASIPDTPAAQALERMNAEFGGTAAQGDTLQLVFHPEGGDVTAPAAATELARVLSDASALPGVDAVTNPLDPAAPYIAPDRSLAVSTLTYGDLTKDQQVEFYDAALQLQQNAPSDLGVELGGSLAPLGAPAPGPGEGVGVILAFLVLALTFGSLIAAGVNLLIAVFGVGVGVVGVLAYGSLAPIGDSTLILASMLGLAVGIDYSLFILSRFRKELMAGRSVEEAVARSTATAGTAVVFAGLTVIIALVALLVANVTAVTEMGISAAFAVAIAVLIALTLLPAMLRFVGLRALSRRQRRDVRAGRFLTDTQPPRRGLMRGWSSFVVKRPGIALTGGLLILVICALPVLSMKTAFNVPGGSDPAATERTAYNLILDEFGGVQSPLIVLAEGQGIASQTDAVAAELATIPGIQRVMPAQVSASGDIARIVVIPEGGPIDDVTKDAVHRIRDDADALAGVHIEVTGETAIGIDQDAQLMQALVTYIAVIVLISLVLMMVLFRSVLIPIVATLGYLLSVGVSFGASVAVFQWGWLDPLIPAPQGDPMLSLLPLILVGVLFGLAMDYQVFLVSRIQEMHHRGMDPQSAIRAGFAQSGPVLAAAASIMIVVFAGFATSTFAIGASIAFGLMVGVAADAFIVRMVLMPATLSLLGRAAWWMPRWLDRILPSVDVEGAGLDTQGSAAATHEPVPVG